LRYLQPAFCHPTWLQKDAGDAGASWEVGTVSRSLYQKLRACAAISQNGERIEVGSALQVLASLMAAMAL
jgi:hypothetical protein